MVVADAVYVDAVAVVVASWELVVSSTISSIISVRCNCILYLTAVVVRSSQIS